jgi:XTP/dITP diphosphohydrolase
MMPAMATILVATSNAGKLRDFAAAAAEHGIALAGLPNFSSLPQVPEDEPTFEANARKKAEAYSRFAPGAVVLADDSGLEVRVLNGAPGVRSARFAATSAEENASDAANNARLLAELRTVPEDRRQAQFVCVIVAARDGKTLATFRGEAQGVILHAPRGAGGFGYDPLFYFPQLGKTFAELSAAEKARVSHRGQAFREFLEWMERQESVVGHQRLS